MRFQALGALEVLSDDGPVRLRPAHRRLVASLLLVPNVPVPLDALIDRMWSEEPPPTAGNALQVHFSTLRRLLPDVIRKDTNGYAVDLTDHSLDVSEFTGLTETAASRLAQGKFGEAADLAGRSARLWRGDPFPELLDVDAARGERHRLVELFAAAQLTMAKALTMQGRVSESIAVLRRLADDHPFNESFWEELTLAYYLAGRQSDALSTYQEAKSRLGEELGIEPGPRLRELEDRILLHDPGLMAPAGETVPNNLPVVGSSFVGRKVDLNGVTDLLRKSHLVTILGAPGIGKTRLALELARTQLLHFPGGVWLARLDGARTSSDVAATIAQTTSLTDRPEGLEGLFQALAARPALLILDNCEHVVDMVETFLADRKADTRLRVLCTSRRRVGARDELVWPLHPLPTPSSTDDLWGSPTLQLFRDRVVAADPGIDIETLDQTDLLEVCTKTGGVPLALELMARWVPSLDLKTVAILSLNRSPIGVGSDPVHHTSVAEAIAWSVSLLSDADQQAFENATVFAAPFTAEAFRTVTSPRNTETVTAETIARLVEASLIQPERVESRIRYRILEPLREFGITRLGSRRERTLRDRHARWFADGASTFAGGAADIPGAETLVDIDESIADYRQAMRHFLNTNRPERAADIAASLGQYWVIRFQGWEGLAWFDECLAADMDSEHRGATLCSAGWACFFVGRYDDAATHFQNARELAVTSGDMHQRASAMFGEGVVQINREPDRGRQLLTEASDILESLDDRVGAAGARYNRAILDAYLGDELARPVLEEAAQVFNEFGQRSGESACHRYLSVLAWNIDDEETARREMELADDLARKSGDGRVLAGALTQRGMVEGRWGDSRIGADAILEALDIIAGHQGVYFALASFGALPVLAAAAEWEMAARLLNHIDGEHAKYGWSPVDERNAAAPRYREEIERALTYHDLQPDLTPVSTPAMAAELADVLTRLRG